jgi:hypothetical protein
MSILTTSEELKRDIHQLVDSVENDVTLVDLHAAVALIIEQQAMPMDTDEPVLSERMSRLAGQLERGEYITNEDMKQRVQQWLAK